jgi:hypothetical protein
MTFLINRVTVGDHLRRSSEIRLGFRGDLKLGPADRTKQSAACRPNIASQAIEGLTAKNCEELASVLGRSEAMSHLDQRLDALLSQRKGKGRFRQLREYDTSQESTLVDFVSF